MSEIVVIAAVETYLELNSRLVNSLYNRLDFINSQIYRLFTENVLACLGCLNSYISMRVCGRADKHRLDFRVIKNIMIILIVIRYTKLLRELFCTLNIYIRNCHKLSLGDMICN